MWVAFFVLLATDRLDAVWTWVRDQSLVLEGILWVAFFPWLLGTAVWESSWPTALRVILVVCFAIGWTLVSIPRKKRERIQVPA
jgi:hypothetical protein